MKMAPPIVLAVALTLPAILAPRAFAVDDPNEAVAAIQPRISCEDFAGERAWRQSGFAHPKLVTLTPDLTALVGHRFSDSLSLTLVVLRGTGWTQEAVEATFQKTAAILANCGILLKEAKLVVADAPRDFSETALASRIPSPDRPAIFFVKSAMDSSDTKDIHFAHSWPAELQGSARSMLANTAWIGIRAQEEAPRDPAFSPVAHELGHLLGETDHVIYGNLMAEDAQMLNSQLSPWQCKLFEKSPLLHGL